MSISKGTSACPVDQQVRSHAENSQLSYMLLYFTYGCNDQLNIKLQQTNANHVMLFFLVDHPKLTIVFLPFQMFFIISLKV